MLKKHYGGPEMWEGSVELKRIESPNAQYTREDAKEALAQTGGCRKGPSDAWSDR